MVEELSEIQFTNMSDDTVRLSISINLWDPTKTTQQSLGQKFQLEFEAIYCIKKMLVRLNTCMHAILKKTFKFRK